jgi:hypothetical protein
VPVTAGDVRQFLEHGQLGSDELAEPFLLLLRPHARRTERAPGNVAAHANFSHLHPPPAPTPRHPAQPNGPPLDFSRRTAAAT